MSQEQEENQPSENQQESLLDQEKIPEPVTPLQDVQPPEWQPATPNKVEIDAELKEEWEKLKDVSPEAAALALEDTEDGKTVRSRLEQYGPEIAQDRAEQVLYRRNQAMNQIQVESEQYNKAVQQHNNYFAQVLQQDHPDYFDMLNNPTRHQEAASYQQQILNWIASKPYMEAVPLFQIAQQGRDPRQVSALISKFEMEQGTQRYPDPTPALAVPGRGGSLAPVGIGDKDDFNAGFDLALSSN